MGLLGLWAAYPESEEFDYEEELHTKDAILHEAITERTNPSLIVALVNIESSGSLQSNIKETPTTIGFEIRTKSSQIRTIINTGSCLPEDINSILQYHYPYEKGAGYYNIHLFEKVTRKIQEANSGLLSHNQGNLQQEGGYLSNSKQWQ